jgi:hypothetical protein
MQRRNHLESVLRTLVRSKGLLESRCLDKARLYIVIIIVELVVVEEV